MVMMMMLVIVLLVLLLSNFVYSSELTDLYFKGFEHKHSDAGMKAGVQLHLNSSTSCSYEATCSVSGVEGVCVSLSSGCCAGTVTSNLCPGSSDIKCCTKASCSTPSGNGQCLPKSQCSGTSVPGYCVGPSDLQCCVSSAPPSTGHYAVDISSGLSSSASSCMASSYSLIIPRGYQSVGQVDPNVCASLMTAYNAGIKERDVYLFPCPKCGNAENQVQSLVGHLTSNCKSYWSGRIWLDIEGSQYWLGSYSSNQNFYKQLKDACVSSGYKCGVYSSYYQWEDLFGTTSFCYGQELPLWYAHYDNSPRLVALLLLLLLLPLPLPLLPLLQLLQLLLLKLLLLQLLLLVLVTSHLLLVGAHHI